jgi:23S rRNA pseudouridine2605 synthase
MLISFLTMPSERLQKIIAAAGIASRRRAEEMISSGVVEVNGQIVTELGSKADPERDHIRVNGKLLRGAERHIYLLMNKPKGYVTTVSDPEGRPTVMNLLRGIRTRVYPVGRLDYASEGLLLLTNDGELAHALTKASSHVQKVYLVKVAGVPDQAGLEKLRRGLMIPQGRVQAPGDGARARDDDNDGDGKDRLSAPERVRNARREKNGLSRMGEGRRGSKTQERVRTAPARIRLVRESDNPWYEVTLLEGKNRQLRKMFEEIGHHVEKIRRVRYGPLTLDIPPGEFRRLTPGEVGKLKHAAGIATGFADRGR